MNRFVLLLLAVLLCVQVAQAADIAPILFSSFNDTIPPAINCPPDDTVQLDPGMCTGVYTYQVVGYDDQPGFVLSQTGGLPSGAEFPIGTTVNSWLITDSGGNTDECSFRVLVRNFPAGLSCKDSVFLFLDTECNASGMASAMLEGGPYGCTDSFLVQIDRTLPVGNGPWQPNVLDGADIAQTLAFRVLDPFTGNSCSGRLFVEDTLPPSITCSSLTVPCVVDSFGLSYLADSLGLAGVVPLLTDNCAPAPELSFTDLFQNIPCNDTSTVTGILHRTWSATDNRGNATSCTQTIILQRLLSDVQIPSDITLSCEDTLPPPAAAGAPFIQIGNRIVSVLDDTACEVDAFFSDSIEVQCGGSRRLLREWRIFDACLPLSAGNPKVAVQEILLLDTLGPSIACPPNLTVQSPAFTCSGPVLLPDLEIYDNCSLITGYLVQWNAGDSAFTLNGSLHNWPGNSPFLMDTLGRLDSLPRVDVGKTTLLFSATDACGNIGLCSTELTLWDMAAPAALCDSTVTVTLSPEGSALLSAEVLDAGSADACGTLSFRARRLGSACVSDSLWQETVLFCCADWGDTVAVALRVYDVEIPSGGVPNTFGAGQYGECIALVRVAGDSVLSCTAPPDTVVNCLDFDPTLESYGQPLLSCSVDSISLEIEDSGFTGSCRGGTLIRTFKVFNASGDSAQCSHQVTSVHLQRYLIRFPDDTIVNNTCSPSGLYGEPEVMEEFCGNIQVDYTDEVFEVVPDACYKIERTWTVYNVCRYHPDSLLIDIPNPAPNAVVNHPSNLPGPVVSPITANGNPWKATVVAIAPGQQPTDYSVFWDVDANGYRYKQIIKIIDSEPPAALACPPDEVLFSDSLPNVPTFWNDDFVPGVGQVDLCESAVNLRLDLTDNCSGSDLSVKYFLFLDLDGDGVQETVVRSDQTSVNGQIAINNVNNPQYMGGDIRVFDSRPVSNDQKYRFWLRHTTIGPVRTASVIWNTPANPNSFVTPKLPLGTHAITWYVNDRCGNEMSCYYSFTVEKDGSACTELVGAVEGMLETDALAGVQYAQIRLVADSPNLPPIDMTEESEVDGFYAFSPVLAAGATYEVTPRRMDNPTNGVTTFDLVLISRHILGQDTLDTPYRIIAADANASGSVTSFDIVELRRLILGVHDTLPNNTSWRFVDKNYVFPNPLNPFQEPFPEKVTVGLLEPQDSVRHHFVGLKVGDTNNSAVANGLIHPEDRDLPVLPFYLEDRLIREGEVVDLEFAPSEALLSCQFTLEYPDIELLDLVPGDAVEKDQFGVFPSRKAFTLAWHTAGSGASPSFVLRGKAKTTARLSDLLYLSGRITAAEAYTVAEKAVRPALLFRGSKEHETGWYWFPPEPNPFRDICRLRCATPGEEMVVLRVFDTAGRQVLLQEKQLSAGEQEILLDFTGIEATGVLQVVLQSSEELHTWIVVRIP